MPRGHGRRRTAATGSLTRAIEPAPPRGSGRIRPLRLDDLPDLVALRRRAFRFGERDDPVDLSRYCERVLFQNPWKDDQMPSLVYEDARGRLAGFIGVIPRDMVFKGRPVRVAVATQMMVAPEERGLAGLQLVRTLFAGPQDLTFSDTANEAARRVWVALGGHNALVYGFAWERTLRPFRRARMSFLERQLPFRAAAFAARPLIAAGDAVASRLPKYSSAKPVGTLEPLDPAVMAGEGAPLLADYPLRPVLESGTISWLLAEAGEKKEMKLAGGMVRTPEGKLAGWFVHYVKAGLSSETLQFVANRQAQGVVMDHLLHDARNHGVASATGRLDTNLLPALSGPDFRIRHQAPWTIVHSRHPEILRTIERGEAFLSRLDGEGWLSF